MRRFNFKDQISSYEKNHHSRFDTDITGSGISDFLRYRARTGGDHHNNDPRNGDAADLDYNDPPNYHGLLSATVFGKGHVTPRALFF